MVGNRGMTVALWQEKLKGRGPLRLLPSPSFVDDVAQATYQWGLLAHQGDHAVFEVGHKQAEVGGFVTLSSAFGTAPG